MCAMNVTILHHLAGKLLYSQTWISVLPEGDDSTLSVFLNDKTIQKLKNMLDLLSNPACSM